MRWILIASLALFLSGCANINPRINPRNEMPINNSSGSIDELKNNQNGVMAEIGKLKQQAELHDSQLKEVQNGLINLNASVSRNENSGVQILQGDGSLILIFSLAVIAMLLWYRASVVKKSADILADEVARFNDPVLNDNILRAAMHTNSEKQIFNLLTKK